MKLEDYLYSWENKPALRKIYNNLYQKILSKSTDGKTLEIGAGIGNFYASSEKVYKIDIQLSKGVDVVADAHKLPFLDGSFPNIVLFDTLHHLQCPMLFFLEAERVLAPGGRIIMVEPGITPISWLLYKLGHEEPVNMKWKPKKKCVLDPNKDPYESNQAIPTILFKVKPVSFEKFIPGLLIKESKWLSIFAYPMSGGFKKWCLVPYKWVDKILAVEEKVLPFLGPIMAFRLLIVLEKK